jgi:hypothetical protein
MAICVSRIGCVMLISTIAYREAEGSSVEGADPGECQKLVHGWRRINNMLAMF